MHYRYDMVSVCHAYRYGSNGKNDDAIKYIIKSFYANGWKYNYVFWNDDTLLIK